MKLGYKFRFQFLSFTALIFLLWAQKQFGWLYLNTKGGFGDLLYVLEKSSCLDQEVVDLYSSRTQNPCSGYIYGSTLIKVINLFQINQAHLEIVGSLLIVLFCLIFINAVAPINNSYSPTVFFLLLFFSPPIILLLERANIDLLILLLVHASGFLISKGKTFAGILVLLLAGTFKFYPLLVAVFMVLLVKGRKKPLLLMLCFLCSIVVIRDVSKLPFLPWDARNMFGNIIWGEYLVYVLRGDYSHAGYFSSSFLGVLILLIVFLFAKKIYSKKITLTRVKSVSSQSYLYYYVLYAGTYITCYFSGLNVDYRLVFMLMAGIYFTKLYSINFAGKIIFSSLLLLSCVFSYNVELLQPIGDTAQLFVVLTYLNVFILLFKSKIQSFLNKLLITRNTIFTSISRKPQK